MTARPRVKALEPAEPAPARTSASEGVRRATKTAELVALDIVRDIVSRDLKPGDRLPLEAEMLAQYRVSRSSLREALRLLEVQGLIAIRPGPGSGTIVGRVAPGNLARTLTLYLHLSGATYDQLLDAWLLAEPIMARLAAQHPDRALVQRELSPFIESNCAGHDHWSIAEGLDFHHRVAELARNPVLTLSLRSIAYIVTEQVLTTAERGELEKHIVDDHSRIAQAIIDGDPATAEASMAEHIRTLVDEFKAYWPRKVGGKVQWR